ncbi:XRE family transcriptional regulator [Mycobacteroides abscessus subsp. massiliense]|uniref:helix-turn-helix domain-containing protein n=1 Tax=Mycobacteroides abscessus TaxID=36809 RepID=UPI0009A708DF|nr:XRE family transcriptional regulator [Mycobacteroides abscessus]SKQ92159.1 XRE family transcriptional regulator [Mycobacteroides abscessus subsp. massiliense]SKR36082.1 XRE family transcriptional regulator [Mycobacteroides abscessus subsp. massiliense]SKT85215.1 XRE family transcriptional regulator [Mycobacteroides abscessus subsp. massiliense]SKU14242.1 XRE family transcriptional regulator [Mycobacteroides abscessus subsp. massiliense]SLA37545.1 XRE family transcriptional regulator [Mycoba
MVKPISVEPRGRPSIGARLRAARQRQGLTLENIAAATQLTKGFISRIERDETSPSVATLLTICDVLSLPVGTLFESPHVGLVRKADAPSILLVGQGADEQLLTPRAQGKVQVVRSEIAPGGSGGPDLYTLNCEVEVLHVLVGSIEIALSDRRYLLRKGDTITFAGREPHSWLNPDPQRRAEVIWVISPAPWHTSD